MLVSNKRCVLFLHPALSFLALSQYPAYHEDTYCAQDAEDENDDYDYYRNIALESEICAAMERVCGCHGVAATTVFGLCTWQT
jgi:hypothetical protein